MTTVHVEYAYDPPLTDEALAAQLATLKPCFAVREIKWLASYVSLDRKTQITLFEAADAHAVQTVHGMLKVPFVRILALTPVR